MTWKRENMPWANVRRLLRERAMTNQDLADALGVTLSTANGFMASKRSTMTTAELAALCTVFGVSPEQIEPELVLVMGDETRKLRQFRDAVDVALRSTN